MNKTLLIVIVVAAALALGIGGAFAVSRALPIATNLVNGDEFSTIMPFDRVSPDAYGSDENWPDRMGRYSGRMGTRGWSDEWRGGMPGGMTPFQGVMPNRGMTPFQGVMPFQGMTPWGYDDEATGERISMDDALAQAEAYAAQIGDDLQVSEVMEFTGNFYAVVIETDSGRGALELLIDPYTGRVTPEIGPNMMWNAKYSHMRRLSGDAENTLSMSEAAEAAQQALDDNIPGAELETDGIDFYGYYSFDYSVDGEIAGMLSVNGTDGQVWFHTWHEEFIGEKEIE